MDNVRSRLSGGLFSKESKGSPILATRSKPSSPRLLVFLDNLPKALKYGVMDKRLLKDNKHVIHMNEHSGLIFFTFI